MIQIDPVRFSRHPREGLEWLLTLATVPISYLPAHKSGRNIFGLSASLKGLVRERRVRA